MSISVAPNVGLSYSQYDSSFFEKMLIRDFERSSKITINDEIVWGFSFGKETCMVFILNAKSQVLEGIQYISYDQLISDDFICIFKKISFEGYLIRYREYSSFQIKQELKNMFIMRKFDFIFNNNNYHIECFWKKTKIKFIMNQSCQLYDISTC